MILALFRSLLDRFARNLGYATPEEVRQCVRSAEQEALRSVKRSEKKHEVASATSFEPNTAEDSCTQERHEEIKNTAEHSNDKDELRYFVSYHFSTGYGTNGFGNAQLFRTRPVSSSEDIHKMVESIQHSLENRYDSEVSVVVLNWRLFEDNLPDPGDKEPVTEENRGELRLVA